MLIGFALCGSFCTVRRALDELSLLREKYEVQGIVSEAIFSTDTRFAPAREVVERVRKITGRDVIHTIAGAEPLGPAIPLDALVICPCTGNTLAKMAHGVTDGAVTMAAKAHLRGDRPLLIALASNDALSGNLKNIGEMLTRKNVYFVPMRQDDPEKKPHSLVAEFSLVPKALENALSGRQDPRIFRA